MRRVPNVGSEPRKTRVPYAADAARRLGNAYNAPLVTIELSMGHRRGALSSAVKQMAERFLKMAATDEVDLRRLKASAAQGEGERNDEIDLIDELLNVKAELTLPDNDPEKSYQIRQLFVRSEMLKHV